MKWIDTVNLLHFILFFDHMHFATLVQLFIASSLALCSCCANCSYCKFEEDLHFRIAISIQCYYLLFTAQLEADCQGSLDMRGDAGKLHELKGHRLSLLWSLLALLSMLEHLGRSSGTETAGKGRGSQGVIFPKGNVNLTKSGLLRREQILPRADYGIGEACSKDDIVLFQGATSPLPSGIPTYTVQIQNACVTECSISNIHVSCGWFSSARLIDPSIFRRLDYDDCLVNDGEPLGPGESLSFQYANSFPYPLSVSSVVCE